jgi:DNA-directed RNA polymerase specialized sigma subunit
MNSYEKQQTLIQMLRQYNYNKASITLLEESINDIVDAGMGISYSKDVISKTNKINSTVEIAVIKIDKFDLTNKIKSMKNTIKSIDAALEALSEIERIVIVKRCIEGQFYYQFIHTVCVCERTAKRIRKKALNKMSMIVFGSK